VRTSRKQQQQLFEELDRLEAELDATEPGFAAMSALLPRATELLDYIAVHAGHALDRWRQQLGSDSVDWDALDRDAQERYRNFIQISGAQIAMQTLGLAALPSLQGDHLRGKIEDASALLSHASDVVRARV
jgi:hypothetical protein